MNIIMNISTMEIHSFHVSGSAACCYYIWPTLVYTFQAAPLNKLNKTFLEDVDLLIRSAVKEVLELPADLPNSMMYSPKENKGLGIFKAFWEAHIQHINICKTLMNVHDPYIDMCTHFKTDINECLKKLDLNIQNTHIKSNQKYFIPE